MCPSWEEADIELAAEDEEELAVAATPSGAVSGKPARPDETTAGAVSAVPAGMTELRSRMAVLKSPRRFMDRATGLALDAGRSAVSIAWW